MRFHTNENNGLFVGQNDDNGSSVLYIIEYSGEFSRITREDDEIVKRETGFCDISELDKYVAFMDDSDENIKLALAYLSAL